MNTTINEKQRQNISPSSALQQLGGLTSTQSNDRIADAHPPLHSSYTYKGPARLVFDCGHSYAQEEYTIKRKESTRLPLKRRLTWGSGPVCNTRLLGPLIVPLHTSLFASGISIGSSVFAHLVRVPNTQTHVDHATCDMCSKGPHRRTVMRDMNDLPVLTNVDELVWTMTELVKITVW